MPKNFIGDARKKHPLPLRLRNPYFEKELGGSKGYRGAGFSTMRKRILYLAGQRSSCTGLGRDAASLQVDHIMPYRVGGLTPHTNEPTNLRVTDNRNNKFVDYAEGAQEKKPVRRIRSW